MMQTATMQSLLSDMHAIRECLANQLSIDTTLSRAEATHMQSTQPTHKCMIDSLPTKSKSVHLQHDVSLSLITWNRAIIASRLSRSCHACLVADTLVDLPPSQLRIGF